MTLPGVMGREDERMEGRSPMHTITVSITAATGLSDIVE